MSRKRKKKLTQKTLQSRKRREKEKRKKEKIYRKQKNQQCLWKEKKRITKAAHVKQNDLDSGKDSHCTNVICKMSMRLMLLCCKQSIETN